VREAQYTQFKCHSRRDLEPRGDERLPPVIFNDHDAAASAAAGPGPGAYNMQAVHSIHRKVASLPAKATSAFVQGAVDRFGRSPRACASASSVPGPGTYALPMGAFGGKGGIASSFVSTVRGQGMKRWGW